VPAEWLSNSSEMSGRVAAALTAVYQGLAQPARARRLRQVLMVLCALWAVLALSSLLWALFPAADKPIAVPAKVINPISASGGSSSAESIDIDRLRGWHLFGEAGVAPEVIVEPETVAQTSAREGIEDGARETRLKLVLRGIVASTEDGLGHAIIEHQSKQAVYAVEDKLPVSGRVVLAKVMPRQVVLDNGGTYELLVLFDDSKLSGTPSPAARRPAIEKKTTASPDIDMRNDQEATALAENYRERLYDNPQSLADVVNVSAVREGGELLGYRLQPGKETEQFQQLGFKPGDMVTSVNGIALDNPANTMRLYSAMRSAEEVVFELKREDQPLTLSVSLGSGAK
jgi:general secretion pathway protein C